MIDGTRLSARQALLLTMPPLLWAGNVVIGRLMVGHMPPLALSALRWVVALLILLPLGWRVLATPAQRARIWARRGHLTILGGLGIGAYNSIQYVALTTTGALNATLIVCSSPVWMLAIGFVGYGLRPTRAQILGAMLSISGVLVVLCKGQIAQLAAIDWVPGDLLMLLAILCWAMYSWMLARPPASMRAPERPEWDWAEFLLVQILFGLVWTSGAAGIEAALAPQAIEWSGWVIAALIYIAIGPSIIAYRCWGQGVAETGPTMAAFFGNLTPLFVAILSAGLLSELPRLYHLLAFGLIVGGIVVSSRK